MVWYNLTDIQLEGETPFNKCKINKDREIGRIEYKLKEKIQLE